MPRYVILEHDWPMRHWDLLLEAGAVLRAWRLLEEPRTGAAIAAEANADHRLMYLEYEGKLSGNRGTVRRWDAGTYEPTGETVRVELSITGNPQTRQGSSEAVDVVLRSHRWQVRCYLEPEAGSAAGRYRATFIAV